MFSKFQDILRPKHFQTFETQEGALVLYLLSRSELRRYFISFALLLAKVALRQYKSWPVSQSLLSFLYKHYVKFVTVKYHICCTKSSLKPQLCSKRSIIGPSKKIFLHCFVILLKLSLALFAWTLIKTQRNNERRLTAHSQLEHICWSRTKTWHRFVPEPAVGEEKQGSLSPQHMHHPAPVSTVREEIWNPCSPTAMRRRNVKKKQRWGLIRRWQEEPGEAEGERNGAALTGASVTAYTYCTLSKQLTYMHG